MTALLALIFKLQFSLTTTASFFFMMAFKNIEADFGDDIGPAAELAPLEEVAPAKPAPKEKKDDADK